MAALRGRSRAIARTWPLGGALRRVVLVLACALSLAACGAQPPADDLGETGGPAWEEPATMEDASFSADAATPVGIGLVDASHVAEGYLAASATSEARLKLQVSCGDMSYNYDLPPDGEPIVVPCNMGSGLYLVRIMQNTTASNYVEMGALSVDVALADEFEPYLRPNVFCPYDERSRCVALARELAAGAANEGEAVRDVCLWVVDNVTYDQEKAAELSGTSGYVPDPDETLVTGTGVCFDYASLAAAMLRSLSIPCKVVTGYVSPSGVYHAWNMVYTSGSWHSVSFSVDPDTWSRVDLTFAAAGSLDTVGDGNTYTDRYTY